MLRVYADQYLDLGEQLQNIKVIFWFEEAENQGPKQLSEGDVVHVQEGLTRVLALCDDLELPVSRDLIKSRVANYPRTAREFELLVDAVYSELKTRLFLFIRPHLAKYYDNHDVLGPKATLAFLGPRNELWDASNALASGLWSAAVFHSMRAAEIGVRVLGASLGVAFPDKPIDLAEWGQILDQADSKIKAIGQKPKSSERDADQAFYSTAAAE